MDGVDCSRTASSPSLGTSKKTGKILAVRVQMMDETITLFQIQVNELLTCFSRKSGQVETAPVSPPSTLV